MKRNCLLAGVGGQGTVLASRLIAQAAMELGFFARTAETIGMAQRGGCVVSHVRIGEVVHSPLIPPQTADLILGFEPGEAVRVLPFLRPGGTVVAATKAIMPVTASLGGSDYDGARMCALLRERVQALILVDGEAICAACGSPKVLNVALLGAAAESGALGFTPAELEQALRNRLPERFLEMNLQAFALGREAAKKGT